MNKVYGMFSTTILNGKRLHIQDGRIQGQVAQIQQEGSPNVEVSPSHSSISADDHPFNWGERAWKAYIKYHLFIVCFQMRRPYLLKYMGIFL
jgi:hypothetical protein